MKKTLALVFFLIGFAGSALTQGIFTFANFTGAVDVPITLNGSTEGLIGPRYKVDVIYDGAVLATQDFYHDKVGAGYFIGGPVEVPGAPSLDLINVTLFGYDSFAPDITFGYSKPFDVVLGSPAGAPPGHLGNMMTFDIVTIPEPSTVAMLALGLAIIICCFRRTAPDKTIPT